MNHKFNQYKYLNIKELSELNKGLSVKDIAKLKNLSPATISKTFKFHGIELVKHSPNTKSIPKDLILNVYQEHDIRESSKILGISQTTLIKLMHRYGIKARNSNEKNKINRVEFNHDWLTEHYVIKNLSASEIGQMLKCSKQVILSQLKVHNITKNKTDVRLQDADWMKMQYEVDGKTFWEIAKECGCSLRTVARWLHHHNIDIKYNNLTSTSENEISEFITKINPQAKIIRRFKMDDGKEIDIMLPELSIGIEFNGFYWHSSNFVDKQYHKQKYVQAKKQNIKLLQIWEHQWVMDRLKIEELISGLISHKSRTMARKCEIMEITSQVANKFCDRYHIQGARSAAINIGLFYKSQLISVMTFNKYKDYHECIRYCVSSGISVTGGAQKLFAFFLRQYKPQRVISYCSCDLFDGSVYKKLGMKLVRHTEPGYFYINDKMNVLSRIQCQKHKLVKLGFDAKKSESEIMKDRKYYQCFNSGNLLFEWTQ